MVAQVHHQRDGIYRACVCVQRARVGNDSHNAWSVPVMEQVHHNVNKEINAAKHIIQERIWDLTLIILLL